MTFKQKLKIAIIAVGIAFALSATASNDVPACEQKASSKNQDTRSWQMFQRLQEIKGMDKSELTRLKKIGKKDECCCLSYCRSDSHCYFGFASCFIKYMQ